MNEFQRLFWAQARAEFDLYLHLRGHGDRPRHLLHLLQMASKKLAKAYFWRRKKPPRKTHAFFESLMRTLKSRTDLVELFGFRTTAQFQAAIKAMTPLALELEELAPDQAGDGPNPEYPWPPDEPAFTPVECDFPTWKKLTEEATGKHLLQFLETAIETFPRWDA
jgi:hypothetical protein